MIELSVSKLSYVGYRMHFIQFGKTKCDSAENSFGVTDLPMIFESSLFVRV